MFFLRFALLAFLTAYSFAMGQSAPSDLNAFGKLVSMLFFVAAPALYFLPVIEANLRKNPNTMSIGLVNTFLGWTVIGWIVALVWAFKVPEPVAVVSAPDPTSLKPAGGTKKCPFCAEDIQAAAIKCKHCGSDLQAINSAQ